MSLIRWTLFILLFFTTACIPQFTPPPGCETLFPALDNTTTPPLQNTSQQQTIHEQPILLPMIPTKIVNEGELIHFPNLQATDPDGDNITYTFTPPLDEQGTWQTKPGDAGEYQVTITAYDGKTKVSQAVNIIVKSINRPPTITIPERITVPEGTILTLHPVIVDPDGDPLTTTYSGWMTTDTKQLTFVDAGTHEIIITTTDNKHTTEQKVIILVENVNQPPVIAPFTDVLAKEGDTITITPTAHDPDGDTLTFSYTPPFNSTGMWKTNKGDAGAYRINVTTTDGIDVIITKFFLVVEKTNLPPTLTIKETKITVNEGETITLNPTATDPEQQNLPITYSGWMQTNPYTTTFHDAGLHTVIVTASDGVNSVNKTVTVVVNDVNRPPVFVIGAFN